MLTVPAGPTGPTRVVWWWGRGPSAAHFTDHVVRPWNQSQSRVRLEIGSLTSDARDRTVAALEAGTGPDLVMIPRAGDFVALARQGHFHDLSRYADSYGWASRLLRPALRMGTVGDRLFGLPRSSETLFLLSNDAVVAPPTTLAELEAVATRAQRDGLVPFGAGCGDFPESCELLWTLIVNHHAGPAAVRAALRGELPWTAPVFVGAIELLQSWFDRGWFGEHYFTQSIQDGLDSLLQGRAAMSPAMTGMLPPDLAPGPTPGLTASPFPVLAPHVVGPLYVFGTASLIGVNARSEVPDEAAAVLDAVFRPSIRRTFAGVYPGDWNLPLRDPDADAIAQAAPEVFSTPAIGLTRAVEAGRFGFASWSFLPARAEALVVDSVRPLAEGRLGARRHLADLQAACDDQPAPALD